ncbi:MAG: Rare lipoprotein [Proteobacteria bacterium]|nr:Rare lipoprotein [Pseudomonadota bacterium]
MKRRPLWSKWKLRVAAVACGLLLLNVALPVWAADKKKAAKPAVARQAKKATHRVVRPALPATEFGPADLIDDESPGLHGLASFYGKGFQGRKTSTGERFDIRQFTAASNRFPLGTMLAVRRVDNERCAIVKVNDRMHAKHRKRVIDVSRSVAEYLGMINAGVVFVRVAPLKKGERSEGAGACHAAFEPEPPCLNCAQPAKLPDFLPGSDG